MPDTAPPNSDNRGNWLGQIWRWVWSRITQKKGYDFWLGFALALGMLVLVTFTARMTNPLQATGTGLLLAGAGGAVGLIAGFLFGIPRSAPEDAVKAGTAAAPSGGMIVNTNLEQISDWLTKIIIGVGLVQLNTIPAHLQSMAAYLATAFGESQPVPPAVVNLILAYFAIIGFLLGYLWTRLYLTDEFAKAARAARDKAEYFEGIIHALLYQPVPYGYTEAIKRAKEYLNLFGENNHRVYTYLTMAYAQQYAHMIRQNKPETERQQIKELAVAAARRASDLSTAAARMLFESWQGHDPEEDDLSIFPSNDSAFKDVFKDFLDEQAKRNKNGQPAES